MTERRETPGTDAPAATESVPTTALSRRSVLASLTATGLGGALATSGVTASRAATTDGADETERIREAAWVETDVDTNESGTPDRVHVRISRPAATTDGEQYPLIATASPYYGEQTHSDSTPAMHYDRAVDPAAGGPGDTADGTGAGTAASAAGPRHRPPVRAPLVGGQPLEQRYVPSGYVVARISALGTHRSTGCYTAAGPPTIAALASVVDWFNGRATAYASRTGEETVTADWTTGRTGLIGASANGELANGLATTGVGGLAAIVPQSANNGQYSLFRSNGTPISVVPERGERMADLGTWIQAGNARRPDCDHWTEIVEDGQDRATGDYNDFWHDREFLAQADAVDAAVLATHAVDDPIVKPNNVADWYEALAAADVPLRLWLHRGGHTSPRSQAFADLLDRWWDHWLKGADTGVMDEDPVTVVRGGSPGRGSMDTYPDWPVPGAEPTPVRFTAGGATAGAVTLDEPATTEESFVDDPAVAPRELVAAAESDHRLRYETPPLGESVHVSGRVVPDLALSLDEPTVVSVALVEYGDEPSLVTRGWADPLNRPAYGEFDSPVAYKESLRGSAPIGAGERVRVEFPLQATDHVVEEGSRIGLVVYASDREFTLHPPGNATVTVALGESSVSLPVVGGEGTLDAAFASGDGPASRSTATAGESGPGFGVGGALAALGTAGTLLGRRLTRDERER